jgi:hypothetical protein
MRKMSAWGKLTGYKSRSGALSSVRSMDRRMAVDRIKHPDWTNPHYEHKVVKEGKSFSILYRYPLKGGSK